MVRLSLVVLLAVAAAGRAEAVELEPVRPITRIAVGSCIRQDKPQPIWQAVTAFAPDVLLLLGDNVYGDTEDMAVLREKYGRLAANAGFAALRAQVPIIAVWDDHDFGADDAGREYPLRRESQQVFLDFFGVAADAPVRKQEGIYRAVTVGPAGKRVQFICLDTRYHRSPAATMPLAQRIKGKGQYVPTDDPQQAVLGDAQWAWLAGVLKEPAEVRVVLSSIQLAATEHHFEHWGNFPRERARLLKAFRATAAGGLVVVSGDRHAAEISRIPAGDAALAYPLYDLTASSLNQGKGGGDEPNRNRVGRRYGDVNFGTIEIDWGGAAAGPRLTLAVRDERGAVVASAGLPLVTLVP